MKKSIAFPYPNKKDSYEIYLADPCYNKIKSEDRTEVFKDAWKFGVNAAKKIKKRNTSVIKLLKESKVVIKEKDIDYVVGNRRYFCEFMPGKAKLTVYKKSVELWSKKQKVDYEKAKEIILAHEYFHYLEEKEIGWASKRYLVPMIKIGKLEIGKTGISALSEIAANAFANEFIKEEEI